MKTHYIYKITNHTTGEYYYGKRSCEGHWKDDSYMGSGKLLKRKMNKHPDHDWRKEVLLLFDTEAEAYEHEKVVIGDRWRDDDCLNLCEGGGSICSYVVSDELRKTRSDNAKLMWEDPTYRATRSKQSRDTYASIEKREEISEQRRSNLVAVIFAGKERYVPLVALPAYLRLGATFTTRCVSVAHDTHKVRIYTYHKTAKELILKHGFNYGRRRTYKKTTLKELKEQGVIQ